GIGCAGTARADTLTPFTGSFTGVATIVNGGGANFHDTFTETGSDSFFGAYTGSGSFDISFGPTTTITNGLFQWIYGGGVLAGTFTGSGGPSSVTITFDITGGLLPGDTASASGPVSFDLNTNAFSGPYSGTITAPGDEVPGFDPVPSPIVGAGLPGLIF